MADSESGRDKMRFEAWEAEVEPDKPLLMAATVVILRDGEDGLEVLMVLRNRNIKFGGGTWVFPGGKVDDVDYVSDVVVKEAGGDREAGGAGGNVVSGNVGAAVNVDNSVDKPVVVTNTATATEGISSVSLEDAAEILSGYSDVAATTHLDVRSAVADIDASPEKFAAACRAAVRETLEETGLSVGIDDMVCFSHWIPPPIAPKRFATWFFAVAAPQGQEVMVDGSEIIDHKWTKPEEMIRRRNEGDEADMLPPTFVTLVELSEQHSVSEALEFAKSRQPPLYATKISSEGNSTVSLWAGDAGYETGDATLPGPRHRLVMTNQNWCYEKTERN